MYTDRGHYLEDVIKATLDNRKYCDLANNMKHFLNCLFGVIDENAMVNVTKPELPIKPDLYIKIKDDTKCVSIKTGKAVQFHAEDVKTFILFLRSLGVSTETQKTILLFHYGDGTMDGTGKKRYPHEIVLNKMKNRIALANDELNDNPELMMKIVDRLMFQGVDVDAKRATHIYFGDIDYGVTVSQKQIEKYMSKKKWKFIRCLHVGPFLLRPQARYVDKKIVSEYRRKHIIAYWVSVAADFEFISHRYNG